MTFARPVTLSSPQVTLVPLTRDDVPDLIDAASDGELWSLWHTPIPSPKETPEAVQHQLAAMERGDALTWSIRRDDVIVGATTLISPEGSVRQVRCTGTWLASSVQGTGVHPAAMLLVLRHCFEALEAPSVSFHSHYLNTYGRSALERLGARLDGVLRNHATLPDGTVYDTAVYSIVNTEWAAVQRLLEQRLQNHAQEDARQEQRRARHSEVTAAPAPEAQPTTPEVTTSASDAGESNQNNAEQPAPEAPLSAPEEVAAQSRAVAQPVALTQESAPPPAAEGPGQPHEPEDPPSSMYESLLSSTLRQDDARHPAAAENHPVAEVPAEAPQGEPLHHVPAASADHAPQPQPVEEPQAAASPAAQDATSPTASGEPREALACPAPHDDSEPPPTPTLAEGPPAWLQRHRQHEAEQREALAGQVEQQNQYSAPSPGPSTDEAHRSAEARKSSVGEPSEDLRSPESEPSERPSLDTVNPPPAPAAPSPLHQAMTQVHLPGADHPAASAEQDAYAPPSPQPHTPSPSTDAMPTVVGDSATQPTPISVPAQAQGTSSPAARPRGFTSPLHEALKRSLFGETEHIQQSSPPAPSSPVQPPGAAEAPRPSSIAAPLPQQDIPTPQPVQQAPMVVPQASEPDANESPDEHAPPRPLVTPHLDVTTWKSPRRPTSEQE